MHKNASFSFKINKIESIKVEKESNNNEMFIKDLS